jgi:hypothetical protein
VADNYVGDQQAAGGGIHVGLRFSPVTPLSGTTTIARNTIVRAGSYDYFNNWNFGTGALWFYALDGPMAATINVTDNHILDSNYEAIHFVGGNAITSVSFSGNEIRGARTYAVENRAVSGSVTFTNTTASELGRGGVLNCNAAFAVGNGGGNGSWITDPPACGDAYGSAVF